MNLNLNLNLSLSSSNNSADVACFARQKEPRSKKQMCELHTHSPVIATKSQKNHISWFYKLCYKRGVRDVRVAKGNESLLFFVLRHYCSFPPRKNSTPFKAMDNDQQPNPPQEEEEEVVEEEDIMDEEEIRQMNHLVRVCK
jgi:hypothetical protein